MIQNLLGTKTAVEKHLSNVAQLSAKREAALGIFTSTKNDLVNINNELVKEQLVVSKLIEDLTSINNKIGEEVSSNQDTIQKIAEVFKI